MHPHSLPALAAVCAMTACRNGPALVYGVDAPGGGQQVSAEPARGRTWPEVRVGEGEVLLPGQNCRTEPQRAAGTP